MGAIGSKSPLERRNTVARRSQRRSIHTIKAKVDKAFQDIKKFKGIDEDVNFNSLKSEIQHLKTELTRKSKDLQPQVKSIYDSTLQRIDEAFKALDDRLKENQEKAQKKDKESQERAEKKKEKEKEKQKNQEKQESETAVEDNEVEIQEIQDETNQEAQNLEQTTEKRKTVEVKFVQIVADESQTQADIHHHNNNVMKSPEEKRKSILKMGIPVMPVSMMNEISEKSNTISRHYDKDSYVEETNSDTITVKVNDIIENLQTIEYQIADFVGKKHGTQYNRIRDRLNQYLIELNRFNTTDDYTLEQMKISKNYVGSCMNFLDEKAVDEEKLQDDVFFPENRNLSPVEARIKLNKLSKTTAI